MSRPVPCPDLCVALPPRLCGPVEEYVAAWAAGSSWRCWDVRFDKRQKGAHRFTIADTRGPLSLTVPIVKPESHRCLWSDIMVSGHGSWWDVHRVALESAYGRTPYFEFYVDRFMPMLTLGVVERYPRLEQLAWAWETGIRDILGLGQEAAPNPDVSLTELPSIQLESYRQVRADKLGFIPSLSILDLIFNLGPEAQIYLDRQARADN